MKKKHTLKRVSEIAPITGAEHRRRHLPGIPSKVASHPGVLAFVNTLLDTHSFKKIAALCLARFGAERAPSKSAVHRYWEKYRAAAARQK